MDAATLELLQKAGFSKRKGFPNVSIALRVHELITAEIDDHDFVTLARQSESLRRESRVTLPRPIRTVEDAQALIHLLTTD